MRWLLKYRFHHLLFWLVYFIFWTYFSIHNYGSSPLKALLATFIYFVAQAGIGYLSIYYLVPRYFFNKRYATFGSLVLSGILLGSLFITLGMSTLFHSLFTEGASRISVGTYFLYAFIDVFFSTLLFIAARVIKERVQAQKMNSTLEKEKTEHELKFLKSQINPHFLFNAINSIYVLIKKDPELAAATLARFSDMLRYQLYECNFPEMPIEKEVEYLSNYIELEKLRKGMTLSIDYKVPPNVRNFVISPLLIIPFVENAFKHVSNFTDKKNFVDIKLNCGDGFFKVMVRNSVDHSGFSQTENPVGGIGQDNTKRRLKLIYPDRHELIIEQKAETYFVSLTIQVQ
jgi:LytS/YehU family sensor histidine kinase